MSDEDFDYSTYHLRPELLDVSDSAVVPAEATGEAEPFSGTRVVGPCNYLEVAPGATEAAKETATIGITGWKALSVTAPDYDVVTTNGTTQTQNAGVGRFRFAGVNVTDGDAASATVKLVTKKDQKRDLPTRTQLVAGIRGAMRDARTFRDISSVSVAVDGSGAMMLVDSGVLFRRNQIGVWSVVDVGGRTVSGPVVALRQDRFYVYREKDSDSAATEMELVYVAAEGAAPQVVDGVTEVEAHGFAFNTSVAVFSTVGERMLACYDADAVEMNGAAVFSSPAFTHYHRSTDGVYACAANANVLLYWSTADMNARRVAEPTRTVAVYGSAPVSYRVVGFVVGTPFLYLYDTTNHYLYACDVEIERPEWKVVGIPGAGAPYRLSAQFVIHDVQESGVPVRYTSVREGAGIYSGTINASGVMVESRYDTSPEDGFDTADPNMVSCQGLTTRGALIGAKTMALVLGGNDSREIVLGELGPAGQDNDVFIAVIFFVCAAVFAAFVTLVVVYANRSVPYKGRRM